MPKTRKSRRTTLHPRAFFSGVFYLQYPSYTSTRLSFTSTDDIFCSIFLLVPLICIRRTGLKLSGISINGGEGGSFVNNISSNPGLSDKLEVPHSRNSKCLTYSAESDMRGFFLATVSWPLRVPALFSQVSSASTDVHH